MNRRKFIANTGLLSAASLLPLASCSPSENTKYKLGYQLFSVNDDMNKDHLTTLKALKAMGYQDFEIYGFDDQALTYYGEKAESFKNILDDLELTVTSGHYSFSDYLTKTNDELKRFVDQCIKGALALGSPYITWPWIAPNFRNFVGFKILAPKLNLIGEQVAAAGLGFAYHNHGYEFKDLGGQSGFDIILNNTDPDLVKLQMDMYWVMHEGISTPKEMVKKQPGRYVMWHIKDMHKESRDYTELGNGSINYHEVLPDPKASGLEYYYIEQGGNFSKSAMDSAATSAKYFKQELQQYL